jgi:hypothetical protein
VSDSWPRAFLRAIPIALWFFALAVVFVVGAVNWHDWRRNVAELKADLDPRPHEDPEMFPGGHEDVRARVKRAADALEWVNRKYGGNLAICSAIGAVLIAVGIAYRQRARPSWKTWVFVAPLLTGLVVAAVAWLGTALRGAMTG